MEKKKIGAHALSSIEKKCTFVLNSYCHSISASHGKSPSHSTKTMWKMRATIVVIESWEKIKVMWCVSVLVVRIYQSTNRTYINIIVCWMSPSGMDEYAVKRFNGLLLWLECFEQQMKFRREFTNPLCGRNWSCVRCSCVLVFLLWKRNSYLMSELLICVHIIAWGTL